MSWTWRLAAEDGSVVNGPTNQTAPIHQTRSDAETWIGEFWQTLAEEGAATASLLEDGKPVYGPMRLAE